MTLAFRTDVPIGESMRLEECLPPPLRISSPERKQQLIANGVAVWMMLTEEGLPGQALVGECYGAPASFAQDPDIAPYAADPHAICMFGCCIFPQYQGRGYANALVADWIERARDAGFTVAVGHAAHPAMLVTARTFGAEVLAERPGWGGTPLMASFFRLTL